MDFEWDSDKSNRCLRERGFDFEFVAHVFEGLVITFADDRADYGEARMIAIGTVAGVAYKVAYTDRDGVRRIISANRASRQERRRWQSFADQQPS